MSDWKYWLKKSGLVRTQRNNETGFLRKRFTNQVLILIDLVEDEDPRPRTDDLQLTMRSKENGRILTLIRSIDHHFTYFTLAWQSNLFKYLMWSQITVCLSIRLTVSRQIDFKVFKPLKAKENISETKFKFPKIDRGRN